MEKKNMAANKKQTSAPSKRIVTGLSAERIGQMKAATKVT
jgi:hypothetical protein